MTNNSEEKSSSTWDNFSEAAESAYLEARNKWNSQLWDIENNENKTVEKKVMQITVIGATACAAIAIQPIPFADIFVLVPTQAFFAARIAAVRGVPVTKDDSFELIKQFMGILGLGMVAQQIAIGVWKLGTFGLGSFLTIPLVFSLTYGLLSVCDFYYLNKSKGVELTDRELKDHFKKMKKEGKQKYKEENVSRALEEE